MVITYDEEVDALLYIRFHETTVSTRHLTDEIAADYDRDGKLADIEILDAMKHFKDRSVLKQVVLENVTWSHP